MKTALILIVCLCVACTTFAQRTIPDTTLSVNLIVGGGLTVRSDARVGGNLLVTGANTTVQDLTVAKKATVRAGARVQRTLDADTLNALKLTVNNDVQVGGSGNISGNLAVLGNIKGGVIEASAFRTTGGGLPFKLDSVSISKSLAVGSSRPVPAGFKMAVGGNIIANGIDIRVSEKWPDYVFSHGYPLLNISEVADYIKQHAHLPGIPSAAEMESTHYSASEMDAKLLQKIEELTLYVIQLEKELAALKNSR